LFSKIFSSITIKIIVQLKHPICLICKIFSIIKLKTQNIFLLDFSLGQDKSFLGFLVKPHWNSWRLGIANTEDVQTYFLCNLPLQTLLGDLPWKAANTSVRPTNFNGSIIKEALVVFRCIEKQGSAQGLPIRTPSPALA